MLLSLQDWFFIVYSVDKCTSLTFTDYDLYIKRQNDQKCSNIDLFSSGSCVINFRGTFDLLVAD